MLDWTCAKAWPRIVEFTDSLFTPQLDSISGEGVVGALQFAMDLDEAKSVLDKPSRFEKVNELLSKLENVETPKMYISLLT